MHKNISIVTGLGALLLGLGAAQAGGSKGSIGVGGEAQINGRLGGLSMNYDMGEFHVGGFFGFQDEAGDDNTDIFLGGRFYYHLHSTAMSDFSVGGSVGVGFFGAPGDADTTEVYIEPGVQTRAFIASNVALSFTAGMTLGVADAEGVAITGQINALAGVHYYFF